MNERLGNITLLYEAATVTTSTIMSDGYGECRLSPLYVFSGNVDHLIYSCPSTNVIRVECNGTPSSANG
jgi:hypothetical protein